MAPYHGDPHRYGRSGSGWSTLIARPAHPEYPSGHTTYARAAQAVLETLAGQPRAAFSLTSAAPVAAGISLRYKDWSELTRDNIDARVWEGMRFRHTDEVGAARAPATTPPWRP